MFPAIFITLIIGSVILMIFMEFKEELIPFIQMIFSVPEELEWKSSIYLAKPSLEFEYSSMIKMAEKELWLALPRVEKKPMSTLLNKADESLRLRIILGNEMDVEQIKGIPEIQDHEVEIAHRPRIHFKLMLTEKALAVGTANLLTKTPTPQHDLVIVSTHQKLVKEARAYFLAFHDEYSDYPQDKHRYSLSSALPRKTKSAFINTSNGLNDLVKDLLSSARHFILLVCPQITNDAAEFILRTISDEVQARIITWVDWQQWVEGQSDPEAVELLLSNRILIESCPNLHANCIIVDNKAAIISSQNLTTESRTSKHEAGIYTKNPELIEDILKRIEQWQPKKRLTLQMFDQEIAKFDDYRAKEPTEIFELLEQEAVQELPIETSESISPTLLDFSRTSQRKRIPSRKRTPAQIAVVSKEIPLVSEEVPIQLEGPIGDHWLEDVVFVGKKKIMEYIWACISQVKKNDSVTIKARGALIYRAVELAELLRTKFIPDLSLDNDSIQINTYFPKDRKRKWGGISQIEITLHKKN